ncbi:hypothetical protein RJT34_17413 [Clitoria ternatea]|uniref:Late embryogenesis abundant protein n=1 Tax=Clitoria ternatea TaxID=43366 RepID=A0AAN9JA75_CLITE
MPNNLVNPLSLLRKQCYAVVAETLRLEKGSRMVKQNEGKIAISNNNNKEKVFWMRDPKSGNWIPENQFEEIDPADLRDKLLPKTQSPTQLASD